MLTPNVVDRDMDLSAFSFSSFLGMLLKFELHFDENLLVRQIIILIKFQYVEKNDNKCFSLNIKNFKNQFQPLG